MPLGILWIIIIFINLIWEKFDAFLLLQKQLRGVPWIHYVYIFASIKPQLLFRIWTCWWNICNHRLEVIWHFMRVIVSDVPSTYCNIVIIHSFFFLLLEFCVFKYKWQKSVAEKISFIKAEINLGFDII